jgi:hypothetical protein
MRLLFALVISVLSFNVIAASSADELLELLADRMRFAQSPPNGTLFFPVREDLDLLIGLTRDRVLAGLGQPSSCEKKGSDTCASSMKYEYHFFPERLDSGLALVIQFDTASLVYQAEWVAP